MPDVMPMICPSKKSLSGTPGRQTGILAQQAKCLMKCFVGNQLQHCFAQRFFQAQHSKILQPRGWLVRFRKLTSPSIFPCLGNVWTIHAPPILKIFK